jgi:hypothetical protein
MLIDAFFHGVRFADRIPLRPVMHMEKMKRAARNGKDECSSTGPKLLEWNCRVDLTAVDSDTGRLKVANFDPRQR